MTKSIGAGLSILSILRDNFKALDPVLERNAQLLREYAVQAGASGATIDAMSLAMDSFIHPSKIMENAIKATAEGAKLLQENLVGASTVIANVSDTIPQMLAKIDAARKASEEQNKERKKSEEDAAKSLAKEEEALEKAAVKSSQERAKAETKAAEEVVAALAKQEASFLKMLEDTNKFVAERDKILNAPNQGFDSSQDASKAKQDLAGLNQQIKAIQDSPIVTEDQDQQLRDLQRQARAAADDRRDLSGVYTLSAMNGEELAQKQNAAWEKYYAIRHANDAIVQRNVDKDLRALGEQTDAVGELGDSAAGVAGAFSDVADAAGSVGDEAKKGTDKAKEGLAALLEGAEEAKPLLVEIRNLLQEIVTLGSQADL